MPKKPITKLKQYPIRIDGELWKEFKAICALKGLTIREALERLIKLYTNRKIEI